MLRLVLVGACLVALAGCATTTPLPPAEARHYAAAKQLHEARATRESAERRAAHYLEAAENAGPLLGEGAEAQEVRDIYNTAVAELTVLLRSADDGHLWDRPLTLTAGSTTYRLRFAPASHALDTRSIEAPHHSIIGDRGKGDTPNSSDGVVEYRSSRLDSAQSELIVPGPHGSYQLTETVSELQRILRLHLIISDQ